MDSMVEREEDGRLPDSTGLSQQAAEPEVSALRASIPDAAQWEKVDPLNPPAVHMIAIYSDGCGAQALTKFDNDSNFYLAEDGFAIPVGDLSRDYSWWIPAPDGFRPHFMEITPEDWR